MTWTKLGAEFSSECALAGLSDAAYRTHCEAIGWLYGVEDTSCRIPKRLLGRFAGSSDAETAIEQLTGVGFWKDAGAVWVVLHHAGVVRQSIAAQQDKRSRDAKAQHRHRRKVSADVSADVAAESVSAQSDRQTVGPKDHAALENQENQDPDSWVGARSVTTPARRGRTSTRSDANSHNPRVHDGSNNGHLPPTPLGETTAVGEQPQTVTRARGTCPRCGHDMSLTRSGAIRRHQDSATRGYCHGSGELPAQVSAP